MADYIASIDQGTTSTRCMIFNRRGEPVGCQQLEHNPNEIWARTQDVIREAMKSAGLIRKMLPQFG